MANNKTKKIKAAKEKIEGALTVVNKLFTELGIGMGAGLNDLGKPVIIIQDAETGYGCTIVKSGSSKI